MALRLKYPLNFGVIDARLQEIKDALEVLQDIKSIPREDFTDDQSQDFAVAEHHFRRALEATLSCGAHLLSRIPKGKIISYKSIAPQLRDFGVVSKGLAEKVVNLARYRNRLVHFYYRVSREELYEVLQKNLPDLEQFIKEIALFVERQKKAS